MPPASTGFNTAHTSGSAQVYNINGDLINHAYEKDSTSDRDVRIYQWLAAPDSSGNFHAARKKHHDKTGAWFIEGREYVNWKDRPDSALWIYGIRESCAILRQCRY
ncbi:hypothetical protein FIBSPDRAFT_552543 [Athelia psychrophila]|uniref:Uncharacterized protein n=1 Tax=Athelia psychrophila TaxID=1759441 RepID=A0A166UXB1_9AGAM|nr:hypothetical protein FIBSPDRAFT_552543 [Fibularhizoctonia sp. CBS 109695]